MNVYGSGYSIEEKKFISIGGGIGSFCWADTLRIHGVEASEIAVISNKSLPYSQFKEYCDNSSLPSAERIRSDSGSRPDNLWGFPGYALSEFFDEVKKFKLRKSIYLLWQIFSEPIGADFYSPKAEKVYSSIEREMERIGWKEILREGNALQLRKLNDGRYAIFYKSKNGETRILIGNIVHLSLGHNMKHFGGTNRVSTVYQPNEYLFQEIERAGGRVLVIGRGIAAARIIERLIEIKNNGANIEIVSLFRKQHNERSFAGWKLQFFNWPKSAFGGHLMEKFAKSDEEKRYELSKLWSIPTAPPRKKWLKSLKKAIEMGFYKYSFGEILHVEQEDQNINIDIRANGHPVRIRANFLIDCSGFDDKVVNNSFYNDLVTSYNLPLTKLKGFKTNEFFEIESLSTNSGKVFVTGIAASGNSYGPVDSFFGQQYGTWKSIQLLSKIPSINFKGLNPISSALGWFKWVFSLKI